MFLSKGLYLVGEKIVFLSKVSTYEGINGDLFFIVTWEDNKAAFPKTLIRGSQLDRFYRLGQV